MEKNQPQEKPSKNIIEDANNDRDLRVRVNLDYLMILVRDATRVMLERSLRDNLSKSSLALRAINEATEELKTKGFFVVDKRQYQSSVTASLENEVHGIFNQSDEDDPLVKLLKPQKRSFPVDRSQIEAIKTAYKAYHSRNGYTEDGKTNKALIDGKEFDNLIREAIAREGVFDPEEEWTEVTKDRQHACIVRLLSMTYGEMVATQYATFSPIRLKNAKSPSYKNKALGVIDFITVDDESVYAHIETHKDVHEMPLFAIVGDFKKRQSSDYRVYLTEVAQVILYAHMIMSVCNTVRVNKVLIVSIFQRDTDVDELTGMMEGVKVEDKKKNVTKAKQLPDLIMDVLELKVPDLGEFTRVMKIDSLFNAADMKQSPAKKE